MLTSAPSVPSEVAGKPRSAKAARSPQPKRTRPAATAAPRKPRKPAPLSARQRLFLRGLGHHLQPVVQVGKDGISDGLLQAIDAALDQHELLKLRLSENAPGERKELATALAEQSTAALVQVMGRTLLLYRRRPDVPGSPRPHIKLPTHPV